MEKLSLRFLKIMKTCNLFLCFFFMGLCFSVPGPTLIDLTNLVHTTIRNIAFIYGGRSLGLVFGSIIGGIILDLTEKKQIILTIFNFTASVSMIGIPFSRQIIVLAVWMVVNGFSAGVLVTGGNVYCLSLWGKNSGPIYQALHLSFGLGGFLAPLIASPFLDNVPAGTDVNTSTALKTQMINETQVDFQYQNKHYISNSSILSITYTYAIIGGFGILVTILFFITSIASPQDGFGHENTDLTSSERSNFFNCTVTLLAAFLILMSMGTEIGYAQMLTAYAVKGPLKLLTTTGSYMTSAYWISFTISRFITVFLIMKFKDMHLFVMNLLTISAGSLVLVFIAQYYIWGLWLASVLLGSGISFFCPAVITWLDKYIIITNKISALFSVTNCIGDCVLPYVISHFIENKPEVFCYVNVITCSTIVIIVIIMYFMLRNVPDKYKLQESKKAEKVNEHFKETNM